MAPSAKRAYADVVIDNTGSIEETRALVEALHRELMGKPLLSRKD
jgi:dephospho-CoA kinase